MELMNETLPMYHTITIWYRAKKSNRIRYYGTITRRGDEDIHNLSKIFEDLVVTINPLANGSISIKEYM